ncbi:MAG: hypothetical protein FWH41_10490 [Treponema sp.]|nr:hypothetical protein [Treponema sp.]
MSNLKFCLHRNRGVKVFTALFLVSMFIACSMEDEESGNLNGIWSNNANGYISTIKIETSSKTIDYADNYQGKIVNSPNFTAANGVIIIEFTKYINWDYSSEPYTSSENFEKIGKFGALYWKQLKPNSVYMADAYIGWEHAMFDTIENATEKFTMDNVGDYINWSIVGPYKK